MAAGEEAPLDPELRPPATPYLAQLGVTAAVALAVLLALATVRPRAPSAFDALGVAPGTVAAIAAQPPATSAGAPARLSSSEVVARFLQAALPDSGGGQTPVATVLDELINRPGVRYQHSAISSRHVDGPAWIVVINFIDEGGAAIAHAACPFDEDRGIPGSGCPQLTALAETALRFAPDAVAEAQALVPFAIRRPGLLPDGVALQEIIVRNPSGGQEAHARVELIYGYRSGGMDIATLAIEQRGPGDGFTLPDAVTNSAQDIRVRGRHGKQWEDSSRSVSIWWDDAGVSYRLFSPGIWQLAEQAFTAGGTRRALTTDSLLTIAESVR